MNPAETTDDLVKISLLDEPNILSLLRRRYKRKQIYTFLGEDILISLNPFEIIPATTKLPGASSKTGTGPADIRTMAQNALHYLTTRSRTQCCIFSGESGSGKTEASKIFLGSLITSSAENRFLEQRISVINPVLEAFGNAATSLNSNSSRFGKFIQLFMSETGQVLGAKISEYLLEKSRVTHRNLGESNFHVFRILMQELPRDQFQKLKLDADVYYGYLQEPDTLHHKQKLAVDLQKLQTHESLTTALRLVGFSDSEHESIFSILAAILALGNIRFSSCPTGLQPFLDGSEKYLKNVANLLKIDRNNLENQLQNLEIYSRGEIISKPYTREEAEDCRDSIAKALYDRLFAWIIYRINEILKPTGKTSPGTFIGILDIFGFEDLSSNSFEQLCINLANEQLQQFFAQKVFKQEQKDYEEEGLGKFMVEYVDNIDVLNLLLGRPIGLFSLLDEESHFPQGSDGSFVAKCCDHFGTNCKYFRSTSRSTNASHRSNEAQFTIVHYAGSVRYNSKGFLEKNRDSLPERISSLLQSSHHNVVSQLFRATMARTGSFRFDNMVPIDGKLPHTTGRGGGQFGRSTRKKLTIGYQFKTSLTALLEKLQEADCSFVRCIKPNRHSLPGVFDDPSVTLQVRQAGILAAVKIRRQGFAYRPTFTEFNERFRGLFDTPLTDRELIERALEPYDKKSYRTGRTKVFIRQEIAENLGKRIKLRDEAARKIQRYFLNYKKRMMTRQKNRSVKFKPGVNDVEEKYAAATSDEVCRWFRDCVYDQALPEAPHNYEQVHYDTWFHGVLTRIEAEELLKRESVGTYLVRANKNSGAEFVLSFRAKEPKPFRHYLIDRNNAGKYVIRGEKECHNSIPELLCFHQRRPLSNYNGCLIKPCGKKSSNDKAVPIIRDTTYDQLLPEPKRRTSRR